MKMLAPSHFDHKQTWHLKLSIKQMERSEAGVYQSGHILATSQGQNRLEAETSELTLKVTRVVSLIFQAR
jgi:hypothetical protein